MDKSTVDAPFCPGYFFRFNVCSTLGSFMFRFEFGPRTQSVYVIIESLSYFISCLFVVSYLIVVGVQMSFVFNYSKCYFSYLNIVRILKFILFYRVKCRFVFIFSFCTNCRLAFNRFCILNVVLYLIMSYLIFVSYLNIVRINLFVFKYRSH